MTWIIGQKPRKFLEIVDARAGRTGELILNALREEELPWSQLCGS